MTKEILRIVPTDSWGKHALEICIKGEWEHLHTDYLGVLELMKEKIEAAYKPVYRRNINTTAVYEVVYE